MACMTAEYLETASRNLSNEVVYGSRSNTVPTGICDGIPFLSPRLYRNLSAV